MEKQKGILFSILMICTLLILNGCAAGPRIKSQRPNERISIQTLKENWENYDVHYSGYSLSIPTGILFDPKDNDIKIGGNRWTKINDQETLSKVIDALPKFNYPDKIEGPEGEIYGYIYYIKREPKGVRSQRAVISMRDANTMIIEYETISTGNGLQRTVR